eukprot:TRINITY_DN101845_c0_g1_i1.p1 TRINITY_DN101845_c0_g1~~TRINITY_DN101845_c0_g1_i1.p1  ORF type:complete len:305 (+),score=36.15 TRINITY_DN101845_c0_g1_i1:87-917(+)
MGHTSVKVSQVLKAASKDYMQVGDVVRAAHQLSTNSGAVQSGTLGTVTSLHSNGSRFTVSWSGARRSAAIPSSSIVKCEPFEFLNVGDVVKSCGDLRYKVADAKGDNLVRAGSLGVITWWQEDAGEVRWAGRSFKTSSVVLAEHIVKCSVEEFKVHGDVVEATRDLTFAVAGSSRACVPCGSLGSLRTVATGGFEVDWWGGAGCTAVLKTDVGKCHPRQYIMIGNVVKAAFDLDYSDAGISDAAGCIVNQGSLGVVIGLSSGADSSGAKGTGTGVP